MPLGVRSDFKPRLFKELIVEKGYNCLIQHAMPCGNIDSYTHDHPKDCKYCHGTGFVYYGDEKTKVLMTSLSKDKRYIISPELLLGQAMITVNSDISLQYRDRIINLDALIRYSQLAQHSNTHIDELRFKIFEIENVYRFGSVDKSMELEEYVDYEIIDNNKIKWINSSNRPNVGEIYSIRYKTHPSWIIISFPHVVRETTTTFLKPHESTEKLPINAMGKLEFLFYKDQLNYQWSSFYE